MPGAAETTPTRRTQFLLICGATLFEFLSLGILLASLPLYVTGPLDGSKAAAGLAVGAFGVSAVVARPIIGRRIDRQGRRRFLILGSLILMSSSLLLYVARNVPMVVIARLCQGLSTACFYTAASTVVADLAPADRRSEYIGRFSFAQYIGFAIGPALGEQLARRYGFGWTWGAAAVAAVAAAVVGSRMAETRVAPVHDPDAPVVAKSGRRMIHPAAIAPGLVLLSSSVAYITITTFSPLFAPVVGLGSSGPLYATFAVVIMFGRLFGGKLADRFSPRMVVFPALSLGAAAFFLLAAVQRPWAAFTCVIVFGAGFAIVFPALMSMTADRVPDDERGEALGTYTAFFDVGASTGGYAIGAIADSAGFGAAFCLPATMCAIGAAIVAKVGGRGKHVDVVPPAP